VVWRQFPLHPEIPLLGGATIEELFGARVKDFEPMRRRLRGLMSNEGLPFRDIERIYNTRLAQELAAWAQRDHGIDLHPALFRAYFAEGGDISRANVLLEVASAAGLPEAPAREVVASRTFAAAVDADWARSRELGLTGVPAFVVGQRAAMGAQPYPMLAQLVHEAGARQRD
jgi:predicted DsbA family dithiol-disulfide isomerase